MKSRKSKIFGNLKTSKFSSEPKAMRELHKIREKMSKMSDEEFLKESERAREKYKDTIEKCETKAKKIEVKV